MAATRNDIKLIMKLHPELILSCPVSVTGFNCVSLSCLSCAGHLPEEGHKIQPDPHKDVFCLEVNSQAGDDGSNSSTAVVLVLKQ